MKVTIADIQKLRKLTSAGLVDCKKALIEAEGDMEKAVEIVRKRGQAIAAKREDRDAAEGRALAKADGEFAAVVAIKCETEPVSNNEKFVNLVNDVLNLALANKVKTAEELKALPLGDSTVAEQIKALSGITGEKMELGDYGCVAGAKTVAYNHFNHKLSTLVAFNKDVDDEVAKTIAMQVASMNPMVALREQIDPKRVEEELSVAIDKTKNEQVQKAVNNALKKAGFNEYYCASEEHMDEAIRKGYMTEDDVKKAKEIIETTSAAKKANLPEQLVQNIAKGRMNKFYQENVLMEQIIDADGVEKNTTVADYLKKQDKELQAIDMKRLNLNAD